MGRTKASLIYRRTRNIRAIQLLLGHARLENTVRCLGIEVDDALEMAEQTAALARAAATRLWRDERDRPWLVTAP
jgi:hypothetical protein